MKTLPIVFCSALLATLASAAPEGPREDTMAPKAEEVVQPLALDEKSAADGTAEEEGIVAAEEHESKRVKRGILSALSSAIGGAKESKFVAIPIVHAVSTVKQKKLSAKQASSHITLPLIGTKIAVPSFALPLLSAKHSLSSVASTVVGTKAAALATIPAAAKVAVASKLASPLLAPVVVPLAAKAALVGKVLHFKTKAVGAAGALVHHKISKVTSHFS